MSLATLVADAAQTAAPRQAGDLRLLDLSQCGVGDSEVAGWWSQLAAATAHLSGSGSAVSALQCLELDRNLLTDAGAASLCTWLAHSVFARVQRLSGTQRNCLVAPLFSRAWPVF